MDLSFITAPIAKFLNERVFGHLPSTITGWLVPALVEVATYWDSATGVAVIPAKYQPIIHVLAGVIFVAGNAYKKTAVSSTPPSAGIVTVRLGLLLSLLVMAIMFALPARAQDALPAPTTPATEPVVTEPPPAPSSPLAVQLTPDLSLRVNVSLVAVTYDVTHKAFLGQVPVTGLYVLTSKRLLDAGIGVGGRVTFGNGSNAADAAFSGSILGALVSPKLSVSGVNFHGALTAGYQFGAVRAFTVGFAPTVEF